MRCQACEALLDDTTAFPGATVRCACGAETRVASETGRADPATPYRELASPPVTTSALDAAAMLTCPFCGAPCTSEARACPHCNVELAAVRCPACFALHFTGARFCSRCRTQLHAEPLLDASDAPCPRCLDPLGTTREGGVFECRSCGGVFVDHTAFAALASEREGDARPFAGPPSAAPRSRADAAVHYVKCPVCREVMNRINFGRRSGVVVDVCGLHGTWFDAGELTLVLEWIASGALADARMEHRARDQDAREAQHRTALHAKDVLERHRRDVASGKVEERSADTLLGLLESFFFPRDD